MMRSLLKSPSVAACLLLLGAAAAGCAPVSAEKKEAQKEGAEHEELVEAMKEHPALQEGASGDAVGPPIYVPTTIPSPAPGAGSQHAHADHPPADAPENAF